jgi:NADH:ubiquinone oxidoreductase subunit C
MSTEEKIQQELLKRFSFLDGKVRLQRAKRLFADVPLDDFAAVLEYASRELRFQMLLTITGLDEGENLGFIYHLAREDGVTLNLKINVKKDGPSIRTVTAYFPGAEIYERELVDLLGARIEGLREGERYPLPDGWPQGQYPLRKDWNAKALKDKEAE